MNSSLTMTAWATLAMLAVYFWVSMNVAKARGTYKVPAPASEGPPEFNRVMRVQMNTLEQIVLVLPAMWLCAAYLGDKWGAAGGALWCVGRVIYAVTYYADASKRTMGFMTTLTATFLMFIGAVAGLIMR